MSLKNKAESAGVVVGRRTDGRGMLLVSILAGLHLLLAGVLLVNYLSHPAVTEGGETMNAFFVYEAGAGLRLYGPLNPQVLELWYTPLSYQIFGLIGSWFGYDIRIMRFIAFLFFVGILVLIGMTIYCLTRNKYYSLIGAGLFAGINAGSWICSPNPNGVQVFFAMLAVYLLVKDSALKWPTLFAATLALFAAFWSKQTGLAYLAAGLFYFWLKDYRKGLAATIFAFLLVAGFAGYYILQPESSFISMIMMHKNHPIMWKWILNPVLFPEMLGRYGILFAIVIAGLIGLGWQWKNWLKPEHFLLGAGAFVGIFCSLKYGSGNSQVIFFIAILIACGLFYLDKLQKENKINLPLVIGLLIIQASVLFMHDYSPLFITAEDDARFQKILNIMATPGKNVHYINQPFYNVIAGTQPYPSVGRDCWRNGVYDRSFYPETLRKFYAQDPFDIIIIDIPLEDNSWPLYERLDKNYAPVMEIPPDPRRPTGNTLRNKKIVFYRKNLVGPRQPSNL